MRDFVHTQGSDIHNTELIEKTTHWGIAVTDCELRHYGLSISLLRQNLESGHHSKVISTCIYSSNPYRMVYFDE